MITVLLAMTLAQDAPPPMVRFESPPLQIQTTPNYKTTDAQFCKMTRKIAKDLTAELPIWVDAITRTDGMSAMCSLRTVAWNKFVKTDVATFRDGWLGRKQAQWNKTICEDNGLYFQMARKGWSFVQNLTFESGERFVIRSQC